MKESRTEPPDHPLVLILAFVVLVVGLVVAIGMG